MLTFKWLAPLYSSCGGKEVMMILALIKALPSGADRKAFLEVFSKGIPVPKGVKVHGTYLLFGKYDMAILYEAPDEVTASKYITKEVAPVAEIERNLAIPIEKALR